MSPTVFREKGYLFFFFSREESRMHVHVAGSGGEAKYWLEPTVELARNHRLTQVELNEVVDIIEARYDELTQAWRTHFSG